MSEESYSDLVAPDYYRCSKCTDDKKKVPVKLWRQYNSIKIDLLCAKHALEDQGETGTVDKDGRMPSKICGPTDQIGWLVPAVPTLDNSAYWGYMSVPDDAINWWRDLPTHPQ